MPETTELPDMPATQLDAVTALIVVDLQALTLGNARVVSAEDVVARAARLMEAFHTRKLPVVIATSTGTPAGRTTYAPGGRDWPEEATALAPGLPVSQTDIAVSRHGLSVFADPSLEQQLRERGVTHVVIVGLVTSFGVESSARAAYDLGFTVTVVSDAVSDLRAEPHENALRNVLPVVGTVVTTDQVIDALSA